jgi:1-acyl-sn-glycerol-3-phosphate acyltransferase
MESRLAYLWYEWNYWLAMSTMTLGFSLRLEGGNNVPRTGPALIIANHGSFLDPILAGLVCRRHLCFLGRKTLFRKPFFRWLITSFNALAIDQEGVGKEGIKAVLGELDKGRAVVVFPEGTRTDTGLIQPLKPGIQLLIRKSRAPVVPVGIAGAFQAVPYWKTIPVLSPLFLPAEQSALAVCAGKPLDGQRLAGMPREEVLAELSLALHEVFARAQRLRRRTALFSSKD